MVCVQEEETMESLPFSIADVYEGWAEVEGTARCEEDVLILEFQTHDSLVGLLKSKVKTLHLPLHALAAIHFQQKFFTAFVTLRVHSMRLVQDLPGTCQGEVRLHVARKHRKVAQAFVTELELRRAEHQLRRLDDGAMQQFEQQVRRLDNEARQQLALPEDEGSH
jgi:hypothetical protein